MKYAIYNKLTGKIIQRCDGHYSEAEADAPDGHEFYLNCPADATHIIDGSPTIEDPPAIPLDESRDAQRKQINMARDWEESTPFAYLGKQFDADPTSIKRLTLAVQAAQSAILAGQTFTITWTCADNSTIDLTEQQLLGALQAMMLRGVELHEKARALKAQIDAATTPEEVAAVTW